MPRRMIDSSIWSNDKFAYLRPYGRLLLIGMINHADDQGRIKAHPGYLRSLIFPYDDLSLEEVGACLDAIQANGTILRYAADGKEYAQMLNWWQYQTMNFATPSTYPPPPGWTDHIRYTGRNRQHLTFNWRTAEGKLLPDTCDANGSPLGEHMVNHMNAHMVDHISDKDKDKDKDKDLTTSNDVVAAAPTPPVIAAETSPNAPDPAPDPAPTSIKSKSQRTVANPTAQQLMIGAVADVCVIDLKLKSGAGRAGKAAAELVAAGYTPEQVAAFKEWWYACDWRGQRGDTPTPARVVELIKQAVTPRAAQQPERSSKHGVNQHRSQNGNTASTATGVVGSLEEYIADLPPEWR